MTRGYCRVLVGCERSGAVRSAFRKRGHDAWSCDTAPPDDGSEHHLQGDLRNWIGSPKWDLVISHPPCTRLCLSGVRWLWERDLWRELDEAAEFFTDCLALPHRRARVCVENPMMHRYAVASIPFAGPQQWVHPWWFGDGYTKKTGLWLRGLPPLMATAPVVGRDDRIHRASQGPNRGDVRSVTPAGIASAMADQWGDLT